MVGQMTPTDQAIVRAIPGNDRCMECEMKSPQWASVSFGTVFCLECSGVHRSLGVHISFVRSIAMDSWTEPQLKAMNAGGNGKCKTYLTFNGISPATPIKAKYESRVAQHYKEVLKARINGTPDPPLPAGSSSNTANGGGNKSMNSAPIKAGEDANGMERLAGESDDQYVVRQTRLRNEAKARMAAKFGNSGSGGSGARIMGGAGKKSMSGIGSDASYNPKTGGFGSGANLDVDSIVSGLGSAFSTLGALGQRGVESASAVLQDQQSTQSWKSVKDTGAGFWSSLSNAAKDIAQAITEPEENLFENNDGLSTLRAHVQLQKRSHEALPGKDVKKYEGFGSKNNTMSRSAGMTNSSGTIYGDSTNVKGSNASKLKKEMEKNDFFSSFGA